MTQQQVADRMAELLGRTYTRQMVSRIENGTSAVDKRSVLIALARALSVSVTDLTGQPYPATARSDLDGYVVAEGVRAALEGPEVPMEPRPIEQLRFAAEQSMTARMACDLPSLGAHLPGLLIDARTLHEGGDQRAGVLLVQAAATGSLALKPAGWVDLAIRLADLAVATAVEIGDPVCLAWATFARAQCALATGARLRSYSLVTGALDGVGASEAAGLNDMRAALGMLHLHAALTAASLHRGDDANAHLDAAADAAAHVAGNPWQMEVTQANVATWRVGVALENGEADRAPELARLVNVTQLQTRQRRMRLYYDTARGLVVAGRDDDAVRAFLMAEAEAPGELRNRSQAVEVVSEMVQRSPRLGGSPALTALARICGVDPFAPVDEG